jgi:hypothetical protein
MLEYVKYQGWVETPASQSQAGEVVECDNLGILSPAEGDSRDAKATDMGADGRTVVYGSIPAPSPAVSISSSNIVGGQGRGALNDEHLFLTSSTPPADLPLVECKMCHGDDCCIRAAMPEASKAKIHCVPNDCSGDVMGGKGVLPEQFDREG